MNVVIHPRTRRHRDGLAAERELLARMKTAPPALRAAWWRLYCAARADRDHPVINLRNSK